MPKRYKSAQALNKMIERLENKVIYKSDTGYEHYAKSPTRKSVVEMFGDIINRETGRFRTYEEAKELFSRFDETEPYTREEYYRHMREFQDSSIYPQLTYRGYMKVEGNKIITMLNSTEYSQNVLEQNNIDLSKLSIADLERMVSKAGRETNRMKRIIEGIEGKGTSRYDSTIFYDYLIQEYQTIMQEREEIDEVLDI